MKDSLCAHCKYTEQVAYSGFFCKQTGYCESKTVAEGCKTFEPDAIDEMTRMVTEKLLKAYQNTAVFTAVKHGRWVCTNEDENTWACSNCNEEWNLEAGTPTENQMHFCTFCGATMNEATRKEEQG